MSVFQKDGQFHSNEPQFNIQLRRAQGLYEKILVSTIESFLSQNQWSKDIDRSVSLSQSYQPPYQISNISKMQKNLVADECSGKLGLDCSLKLSSRQAQNHHCAETSGILRRFPVNKSTKV